MSEETVPGTVEPFDIRTAQGFLNRDDMRATVIGLRILNRGGQGVRSRPDKIKDSGRLAVGLWNSVSQESTGSNLVLARLGRCEEDQKRNV